MALACWILHMTVYALASGRDRDCRPQGPEVSWKALGKGAFTSSWGTNN